MYERATRFLYWSLAIAVAVSVVFTFFGAVAVARAADLRTPDHGLGVAQAASRFSRLRRRAVPRRRR